MATLADLATRMNSLRTAIPQYASEKAKSVARAIEVDLATVTPVDVGTAVSNWTVTLDNPAEEFISAFSPSERGKSRDGVRSHANDPEITRSANLPAILASAEETLAAKQPGQIIYITNNAPYIGRLNDGSSTQAPSGFVERSVIVGENVLASGPGLTY